MSQFVQYQHQAVENEEGLIYEVLKNHGGLHVSQFTKYIDFKPKSITYGFANITIAMPTTVTLGGQKMTFRTPWFCSVVVKTLKDGNKYLGFKQEQSSKDNKWYDVVGPLSAPFRAALTRCIFELPEVNSAVQEALAMAEQKASAANAGEVVIDGSTNVQAEIEIPSPAATSESNPFQEADAS